MLFSLGANWPVLGGKSSIEAPEMGIDCTIGQAELTELFSPFECIETLFLHSSFVSIERRLCVCFRACFEVAL